MKVSTASPIISTITSNRACAFESLFKAYHSPRFLKSKLRMKTSVDDRFANFRLRGENPLDFLSARESCLEGKQFSRMLFRYCELRAILLSIRRKIVLGNNFDTISRFRTLLFHFR